MKSARRQSLQHLLAAAFLAAAPWSAAIADTYPSKPIRVIVPYPAGGGTDIIGRLIGAQLSQHWGQGVIVENKPGASGMLGNDLVAKAPGDGYTVLLGITALVQIPSLYKKVPYKLSDLTPVSQTAKSADLVMVPRSSGIKSLAELVAQAKADPAKFNFGSYGNATSSHLNGEQFKMKAGIDLTHVPYQGSGPEMAAMLGGQLASAFVDATGAYPHIKSEKITILAVTGQQRHPALPEVKTMAELGYSGFEANGWFGFFLPASTPQSIVDKLGAELAAIVKQPDIAKRLSDMGLIPVGSTPQEFRTVLDKDAAHWKSIVDAARISVD
ncbi:tripartite tricarboxylate transporter substrate binding protein [Diaphorobacter sp. HDW4A]|uniref:Bug family tripartite tricarboxylate transporter substrate binding protein n=1 Tax=Diaphorobacter sp. HDW4A TaxID=2714924 RepID=UPI00140E196F|nr:tripartite tricarboxylate transporter substrate binding protein [Diaphorobacter sp. HDW4A]QIL82110.1 tripartite tricarboxylate transporter substrate binding protein [Diaphorobacter sp. HDW4A]